MVEAVVGVEDAVILDDEVSVVGSDIGVGIEFTITDNISKVWTEVIIGDPEIMTDVFVIENEKETFVPDNMIDGSVVGAGLGVGDLISVIVAEVVEVSATLTDTSLFKAYDVEIITSDTLVVESEAEAEVEIDGRPVVEPKAGACLPITDDA